MTIRYVSKFGEYGTGDGQFESPLDVAADSANNIYVVDNVANRVQKFSAAGTFLLKWGVAGTGYGEFNSPSAIGIDTEERIYVVDAGNNRIQKFNSSGTFITAWGSTGTGDNQFDGPVDLAISTDGYVYVLDSGNGVVKKFTTDGVHQLTFGIGIISNGRSIAIRPSGNVLVLGYAEVFEFTPAGAYAYYYAGNPSAPSNGWENMASPARIEVDRAGNIYITFTSNKHRIQKLGYDWAFLDWGGTFGADYGQLDTPSGITFDRAGHIIIADRDNTRIQLFGGTAVTSDKVVIHNNTRGQPFISLLSGLVVGDRVAILTDLAGGSILKKL